MREFIKNFQRKTFQIIKNPETRVFVIAFILAFFFVFGFPIMNVLLFEKIEEKNQKSGQKVILTSQKVPPPPKKKIRKLRKKEIVPDKVTPKSTARANRSQLDFNNLNVAGNAQGSGLGIGGGSFGDLIFEEGDLDVLPIRLTGKPPQLPDSIADSGITGVVKIEVVIDETGKVVNAKKYSEDPEGYGLANACINAILYWTFKPGEKNNIPVKCRVIKPFRI